ncbi:hypothetical protein NPX13_g1102 [Xylaria arbuscula]|uniref:SMP-30/Gluconolactonase/LRE-like region domain-containing protein n=1 Tax=Xylaria arbuscula TaxID=114810 RepID=A0A9W8NMP9_9PEZI|nr:hypothetical protein NPX13_g1102 [Xylaria arbuscula]
MTVESMLVDAGGPAVWLLMRRARVGRLWRLEGGKVEDMSEGNQDQKAAVINGPVWSPDGKIMYTCNTPEGKIYYSDYNIENGSTTNRQVFAHLEGGGMPDGLAVDEDGHVWAAANSQGKLVRISPEGQIVATCAVPDAKMTSCPAFGGNDMKTLFITSISSDSSTGYVYRCTVDVPGIPRNRYKL